MHLALSRLSLRQLLPILFFLIAAVPAGFIGVVLIDKAWDRELQTVREQHIQLARNMVEALERYAEDVQAVFQLLVMTNASTVQALPRRQVETTLRRLHFKHLWITNASGQVDSVLFTTDNLLPQPLSPQLLDRLKFAEADADHPPEFSDVLADHQGEPTIFLWQPLAHNRYAIGTLKTDYFVRLQSAIRFGKNGYSVIVDRRGHIIAHPHPPWRARIQDLSQVEPVRRMMAGETGVAQFFSFYVQEEVIAGFTTTPKARWGVMIPQPLSELESLVGHVKRTVWLVVGLALFCAAGLGGLVSRYISAPLHRIGQTAARFATGSYDARVGPLGAFQTREMASLASQFNTMADKVNDSWQAQHDSEQRCREFADIAADWFWETDLHQVYTYISQPVASPHQDAESPLLGHHRQDHVVADPNGDTVALIQRRMDREEPFDNIEYQVLGREDHPICLSVSGRPILDTTGKVVGYRGVAKDVSELLRTQAELRQAQHAERLQRTQKMEAIGTLAGGIAHDFNNSLGVILGYTELVLNVSKIDETARWNLQQVLASVSRAKELVQQILTFGRQAEPECKPVNVHAVVTEALTLLRATLPTTIAIHYDQGAENSTVLGDATQIHQILMNLGANAEYAMRQTTGTFNVRLDTVDANETLCTQHTGLQLGPYVRLTICDSGCGMAPDVLNRIFEPFFTTKEVGEGTGMGLAVVHGIVTHYNGVISVQSTPEHGTRFEIYLPRIPTPTEAEDNPTEMPVKGNGSILFIDDDERLARAWKRTLDHLGYNVTICTKSPDALDLFRQTPHHFDLVITDQTMPSMTGSMLAHEFRQIRPDIPIILCTGFSYTIDAEQAKQQEIDVFLMKPVGSRDLSLAIQRLLSTKIKPKPHLGLIDL